EHADEIISLIEEDADYFFKETNRKSHVLPTGVSEFAVYERLPAVTFKHSVPKDPTAVFLGYFGHSPNVEGIAWYLEHIHPQVKKEIPNYKIMVVGRGPIEWLKSRWGDDQNVRFTGAVDDFIPYLVKSRVCIAPLISGAGIRGKVNQYAAVGR